MYELEVINCSPWRFYCHFCNETIRTCKTALFHIASPQHRENVELKSEELENIFLQPHDNVFEALHVFVAECYTCRIPRDATVRLGSEFLQTEDFNDYIKQSYNRRALVSAPA